MSDLVIRKLDERTLKHLKARARRHGRSLQSEARLLLKQASAAESEDVEQMLARWKKRFSGRRFSDSAKLIRQDRNR